MKSEEVSAGQWVVVSSLGSEAGLAIKADHLRVRKVGVLGTVIGPVPGHGGDVFWVRHSESKDVGAYASDELSPGPNPTSKMSLLFG